MMPKKMVLAILAGFLFWLATYLTMKLLVIMNVEYNDIVGVFLYFIMPFLFGGALIIVNKESNYAGAAYSAMIIIIRYMITFVEVRFRHPAGPSPFEQTLFFFKLMGGYSIICAILGGILGVALNKKVFNVKKLKMDR